MTKTMYSYADVMGREKDRNFMNSNQSLRSLVEQGIEETINEVLRQSLPEIEAKVSRRLAAKLMASCSRTAELEDCTTSADSGGPPPVVKSQSKPMFDPLAGP